MGREDLIKDERFKTNELRVANLQELIALIEGWLQGFPTDAAAIEALQAVRVPVAPILTVPQAIAHPHHRARGTVRQVSDRMLGEFDIPGMPLRFSGHPELPELQAPFLGEHNGEILAGLLGYDAARVAELEGAGVLVSAAH
jgi:crotonobetainyl-CoA:carnitine CoA-transferase CaiB-like acyl-CoA transferase